jgi:hypothetical protein
MRVKPDLTTDEVERLVWLEARMGAMDTLVRQRSNTELANRMAHDLAELERITHGTKYANLVDAEVKTAMGWVFNATREEVATFDAYVVEHNRILKRGRDRAEAAAQRAAVRSAMCGKCFLIHRRSQIECE